MNSHYQFDNAPKRTDLLKGSFLFKELFGIYSKRKRESDISIQYREKELWQGGEIIKWKSWNQKLKSLELQQGRGGGCLFVGRAAKNIKTDISR